ncbi:MAG: DUF6143 family protein [Pelosinus sp.]|nr:DUF6143 family protein [Pelosinus sp.]
MLEKTVNIPISLFESSKGRYFVGQTELLNFGNDKNAVGRLYNPHHSQVNLFVNVITISNMTELDFLAQIWFNAKLPGKGTVSNLVTPSNTALCPSPKPKVLLQFADNLQGTPSKGVNPFDRVIPPITTVVDEEDGKFIVPPGGSFAVFLVGQGSHSFQGRIALGWWEEKIKDGERFNLISGEHSADDNWEGE